MKYSLINKQQSKLKFDKQNPQLFIKGFKTQNSAQWFDENWLTVVGLHKQTAQPTVIRFWFKRC